MSLDRLKAFAVVATLSVAVPAALPAQWHVGAAVGFVRFQGGSEPTDPADTVFLEPYGPFDYRLRISYRAADWQFALAGSYSQPGLGAGIDDFLFMDRGALRVITVEPTIGRRVLGQRAGATRLWLEAGPSLGFWTISQGTTRKRLGGIAAATIRQRLAGRFETTIRADVSLSPSFFDESDGLQPLLRHTNVSRYGVSVGFDYRP